MAGVLSELHAADPNDTAGQLAVEELYNDGRIEDDYSSDEEDLLFVKQVA